MEKLFDTLLFNMMDLLLDTCAGCLMMEWLVDDWMEPEMVQMVDTKYMLN